MLYFRSCPRCKTGTIQLESDFYGSFLSCLNCGFEKSAASVRKLNFEEMQAEAELEAASNAPVAVGAEDAYDDDSDDDYEDDAEDLEDEVPELRQIAG